ncbi:MAG: hypothetical protein LLF96_07570 [Eubacteriales bacterium]|nr:hypothetical protein [Eubacteriales bacterium]
MRKEPDYIALACAVGYLLCFLFLPFYQITFLGFSGWQLMQYSIILCLPLIAGVLMALGCLLFDARVSIGIGAASLLVLFILLLTGKSILLNGNALTGMAASLLNGGLGFNITSALPLSMGIGGIFAILLAVGFIVAEVLYSTRKAEPSHVDPFTFDV